ncbi:surface lipoprotein assembly modifier [Haemophilus influenzae]|nr:surface lipoprotein assembly modifier [Haemophilus influenzae]
MNTSLSLWHRALHFKGITPRLTLSHRETRSNDVFNEYEKNRAFVEFNKTF